MKFKHNILIVCDLSALHGVGTLSMRLSRLNLLDGCQIKYYSLGKPTEYSKSYIDQNEAEIIVGLGFGSKGKSFLSKITYIIKNSITMMKIIFFNKFKDILHQLANKSFYPDIILSVSSETLILSFLMKKIFPDAKLITGVFFQAEYSWIPSRINFFSYMTKKAIKALPESNIFTMNQNVLDYHKPLISNSLIIPLFIDIERFSIIRNPKRNKIISVGQIIPFKTYNFYMLNVIYKLLKLGYNFEYHIYGHGSQELELIRRINEMNLGNNVFFHGEIDYKDFPKVLSDAYVFIGMGTSIIEASSSGVPSILASPTVEAVSYGWYFEQEGYHTGENLSIPPRINIEDMLIELNNITHENYLELCEKSKIKAELFSFDNVSKLFFQCFDGAKDNKKVRIGWLLFMSCFEMVLIKTFKLKDPNQNRRIITK